MKPTLQQEENLKAYLSDILKYRETIDEVYDHVLSDLEEKPENVKFQDAVNSVLNLDFGGGKGLVEMEKQNLRDTTWEGFVKMFKYVRSGFQFPNIFYTITLYLCMYYINLHTRINYDQAIIIFPLSALFLLMLTLIRKFFIGYYTGDTRKSIQDVVIEKLISGPNWILVFSFVWYPIYKKQYQSLMTQHLTIIAGILTLYVLFIIATIRISIEEFRTYKTA